MPRILIIGSGGQGRVVADLVRAIGDHEIVGVLDDLDGDGIPGVQHLGKVEDIADHCASFDAAVIGIGDNTVRYRIVQRIDAASPGVNYATLVHPSAVVASGVEIGPGSVVMAGAVIQTGTTIGRHCVVNTSASVDHDNQMGDFSSVGPGVCTGGEVSIGELSFVGMGSMVAHELTIGRNVLIGAGATVLRTMSDNVVAFGTPATAFRSRREGESML